MKIDKHLCVTILSFSLWKTLVSLILISFLFLPSCNKSFPISFTHHTIANPLPGNSWGTGGFTLADYDNDGDMDVTVQRRSDSERVYLYFNNGKDKWVKKYIGTAGGGQLGSSSLDVNGDGCIDLVMGHLWLQNPCSADTSMIWETHFYNGNMLNENHDIVAADINLDGKQDLVMYSQSAGILRWYNIGNPYDWTFTDIANDVNADSVHSGLFPNGVADLDNDKFPDIIMPVYWYKNPGTSGGPWVKRPWPYKAVEPNSYGKGLRVWAGDLNNDGFNDFIYSDCDVKDSKIYILFNVNGGQLWKKDEIAIPASNVINSGSFHSLQVADFDDDGDLDIFAGEQEDPDKLMKPKGLKERGIIFQNAGTLESPEFHALIIHEDNPGWHDALIGDVDGDGDIDIVSKVWNADSVNYHLDFWENTTRK